MTTPEVRSPVDIRPGTFVVVAYANYPIAMNTVNLLLQRGCRVRAVTPSEDPAKWLDDVFDKYVRTGQFERVRMYPIQPIHRVCFSSVLSGGVEAVVFTSRLPSLNLPTEEVWDFAEKSVVKMLEAAAATKTVRAVVYTSSIVAAAPWVPNEDQFIDRDSWNIQDALKAVDAGQGRCNLHVMRNSALVKAEQALWTWNAENQPNFKVNVVSPSNVIGGTLGAQYHDKWRTWIWRLYRHGHAGQSTIPGGGPLQSHWYVDTEDISLLEVAAIFDPDISGGRIQAWGCVRNVNDAVRCLLEHHIEGEGKAEYVHGDGIRRRVLTTSNETAERILKKWKGGRRGFKSFKQTIDEIAPTYFRITPLPSPGAKR